MRIQIKRKQKTNNRNRFWMLTFNLSLFENLVGITVVIAYYF